MAWRLSACSAVRDEMLEGALLPRRESSRASPLAAAAAAAVAGEGEGGGVCRGRGAFDGIVLSCFPSSSPSSRFLLALLPSFSVAPPPLPLRALDRDSNASKAHEESEPGRTERPSIPPQKPEQSSEGGHGSSIGRLGPWREGAEFDAAPRKGAAIGEGCEFAARGERRRAPIEESWLRRRATFFFGDWFEKKRK